MSFLLVKLNSMHLNECFNVMVKDVEIKKLFCKRKKKKRKLTYNMLVVWLFDSLLFGISLIFIFGQ